MQKRTNMLMIPRKKQLGSPSGGRDSDQRLYEYENSVWRQELLLNRGPGSMNVVLIFKLYVFTSPFGGGGGQKLGERQSTPRSLKGCGRCKYIWLSLQSQACGPGCRSSLYIHTYRAGYLRVPLRDDPYIRGKVIKRDINIHHRLRFMYLTNITSQTPNVDASACMCLLCECLHRSAYICAMQMCAVLLNCVSHFSQGRRQSSMSRANRN